MTPPPPAAPTGTAPPSHAPVGAREAALVAAVTLGAAALRAADLGRESLWLDELASLDVTGASWGELLVALRRWDVHPPLYFALLKAWRAVAGSSEAAVRSPSVAAGVGSVVAAWALARRAWDARAGLVAAALVACSPFCVFFAREARAYSLLLCASLVATWLLVRAAPGFRARGLAAYAVAAAALPYTHVFGFFTLGAHAAYVAALWAEKRSDRGAVLRVVAAWAVVAAVYAPWVPATIEQARRVEDGFWIRRPPAWWVLDWGGWNRVGKAWVAATVAGAAVTVATEWRRARALSALVVAGVLLPTAIPVALSHVSQPIFKTKYAIAAAGLALVAAAPAIARMGRRRAAVASVALCALGVFNTGRDVLTGVRKEQWRELLAFASAEHRERGTPLVAAHYAEMMRHYAAPGVTVWRVGREDLEGGRESALARRLAERGARRFWMLDVHPARTDPALEPLLRARWAPAERRTWHLAQAVLWVERE